MNKFVRPVGVFVMLLGLVLWGQQRSGAFENEFGAHPDEAAHFVSALMIRDYLAQLGSEEGIIHPKRYAEEYYAHYPKVAIGNWPPGFHLLQALWMLILPPGQASIFFLMALLTASLGLVTYLAAKPHVGRGWALAASMLLVVLRIMQEYSSLVMTEVLVALLVFLSVLAYWRFVETKGWRWGLGFGILASAAILVKGSALMLGLIPPLAVLLLRRWDLLKTPAFWLPAGVVGLLCAPWYLFTFDLATDGWAESTPSIQFFASAFFYNLKKLLETGGPVILLMTFLGLAKTCLVRKPEVAKEDRSTFFPMLGILFLSVPIFHCIVPAGMEHRHLIPTLPVFVVFAVVGMRELSERLSKEGTFFEGRRARWILGGVALAGMYLTTVNKNESFDYKKGYSGFRAVVEELYKVEDWSGPVLISSDASGEGMFVAEAALADNSRPSKKVVRATKALADSKWSGGGYKTVYEDRDALRKLLQDGGYWAIVIDGAVAKARPDNYDKFAHMKDLEELCRELQLAERFTIYRGGTEYDGDIVLYRSPKFPEPEKPDFSVLEKVSEDAEEKELPQEAGSEN